MNPNWTEAAQLYLILHQSFFFFGRNQRISNLNIRIILGAFVSRSFTFTVPQRRNDLHLTSSEERLFLHHHCIALHILLEI